MNLYYKQGLLRRRFGIRSKVSKGTCVMVDRLSNRTATNYVKNKTLLLLYYIIRIFPQFCKTIQNDKVFFISKIAHTGPTSCRMKMNIYSDHLCLKGLYQYKPIPLFKEYVLVA